MTVLIDLLKYTGFSKSSIRVAQKVSDCEFQDTIEDIQMEILLADDNLKEIGIITELIKDKGSNYNLIIINNGIDTADYLFNFPPFTDAKRPDIVILKDNLQGRKGIDILAEVKQSHLYYNTTVVIISEHPTVKAESYAYHMGADGYFVQPEDHYGYCYLIDIILNLSASNQ